MNFILQLLTQLRTLPLPKKAAIAMPIAAAFLLLAALVYRQLPAEGTWRPLFLAVVIVCACLLLGLWYVGRRRERQEAKQMEDGLLAATKSPMGASVQEAELEQQFEEKLRDHIALLKSRKVDLYTIPWYVLIGEPASGKSMMLQNSGLTFEEGARRVKGAGGTLYVDWWLAMEGVILDTAGRLVISESDTQDPERWERFLKMLVRARPHCPVNGAVVVVPSDSLLGDPVEVREEKARKLREALKEVQRILQLQFPLWLVVTKADLILGFMEFVSDLSPEQQRQMFGWSNPKPADQPFDVGDFAEAFEDLAQRVEGWKLRLLSRTDLTVRQCELINQFPNQFARLREALEHYIQDILLTHVLSDPLFFRGFYFTSGTQQGIPIPAGSEKRMGESGLLDRLQDLFPSGRAFFIRDFFRGKVFQEQGLVIRPASVESHDKRTRRISNLASVGLVVAASLVVGLTWWRWKESGYQWFKGNVNTYQKMLDSSEAPDAARIDELATAVSGFKGFSESSANRWLSGVGGKEHIELVDRLIPILVRKRYVAPVMASALERLQEQPGELLKNFLKAYSAAISGRAPAKMVLASLEKAANPKDLHSFDDNTLGSVENNADPKIWAYEKEGRLWDREEFRGVSAKIVKAAENFAASEMSDATRWYDNVMNAAETADVVLADQLRRIQPVANASIDEVTASLNTVRESLTKLKSQLDAPGRKSEEEVLRDSGAVFADLIKAATAQVKDELREKVRDDLDEAVWGQIRKASEEYAETIRSHFENQKQKAGQGSAQYLLSRDTSGLPMQLSSEADTLLDAVSTELFPEKPRSWPSCPIRLDDPRKTMEEDLKAFDSKAKSGRKAKAEDFLNQAQQLRTNDDWRNWGDILEKCWELSDAYCSEMAASTYWENCLKDWSSGRLSRITDIGAGGYQAHEDHSRDLIGTLTTLRNWLERECKTPSQRGVARDVSESLLNAQNAHKEFWEKALQRVENGIKESASKEVCSCQDILNFYYNIESAVGGVGWNTVPAVFDDITSGNADETTYQQRASYLVELRDNYVDVYRKLLEDCVAVQSTGIPEFPSSDDRSGNYYRNRLLLRWKSRPDCKGTSYGGGERCKIYEHPAREKVPSLSAKRGSACLMSEEAEDLQERLGSIVGANLNEEKFAQYFTQWRKLLSQEQIELKMWLTSESDETAKDIKRYAYLLHGSNVEIIQRSMEETAGLSVTIPNEEFCAGDWQIGLTSILDTGGVPGDAVPLATSPWKGLLGFVYGLSRLGESVGGTVDGYGDVEVVEVEKGWTIRASRSGAVYRMNLDIVGTSERELKPLNWDVWENGCKR